MSLSVSRAVLRRQQWLMRRAPLRFQSTTSEAASKAKETASKAQEGLSRVTSSAGSAISRVGSALGSALGGIGGRTGRVIGAVQSLIPPTIYYSRVGLELGKIIFEGRAMSPPSGAQFQSYFQSLLSAARNPSQFTSSLQAIRNVSQAQLAAGGVILAEVLGFFTVGTMIGRLKITGYHSKGAHHEH